MVISFDIPNAKLTRLGDVLHIYGYIYDPNSGVSDSQQKINFLKKMTIDQWTELLKTGEKTVALQNATSTLTSADLSDIS